MFHHVAASSKPRTLSDSTPAGTHDFEPGFVPPLLLRHPTKTGRPRNRRPKRVFPDMPAPPK